MIKLTQEHTKVIRAVILKTAGASLSSSDVNDLVQDSALHLLEESGARSLKEYDAARGMSLNTFIGMVAKSVTMDYLRHRGRVGKKARSLEATQEDTPELAEVAMQDHGEDALAMLIRREQRERLVVALQTLSEDDRELLEAILTGGEDAVRNLAKERGVKEVAIRVKKHRIAERLRRALQSQG